MIWILESAISKINIKPFLFMYADVSQCVHLQMHVRILPSLELHFMLMPINFLVPWTDELTALTSKINQLNIQRRQVLNEFLDLKG